MEDSGHQKISLKIPTECNSIHSVTCTELFSFNHENAHMESTLTTPTVIQSARCFGNGSFADSQKKQRPS